MDTQLLMINPLTIHTTAYHTYNQPRDITLITRGKQFQSRISNNQSQTMKANIVKMIIQLITNLPSITTSTKTPRSLKVNYQVFLRQMILIIITPMLLSSKMKKRRNTIITEVTRRIMCTIIIITPRTLKKKNTTQSIIGSIAPTLEMMKSTETIMKMKRLEAQSQSDTVTTTTNPFHPSTTIKMISMKSLSPSTIITITYIKMMTKNGI